jgi:two-component system response regulator LytT
LKILIVEDEPRAANRLARLIMELQPGAEVLAKVPSVEQSVAWLEQNPSPDLIFMDIRLDDGESFDILERAPVESPIIFCTAYSEYALQAFAVNSIDYLLKPVVRRDLARALRKYQCLGGYRMPADGWPKFPPHEIDQTDRTIYRQQFLVALAGKFRPVRTVDLVAAKSYMKATQLIDNSGAIWLLDDSLVSVESHLDPAEFIRVSRQVVLRESAIELLDRVRSGYVALVAGVDAPISVSRSRVASLKRRLGR